jgi:hypothetical protein
LAGKRADTIEEGLRADDTTIQRQNIDNVTDGPRSNRVRLQRPARRIGAVWPLAVLLNAVPAGSFAALRSRASMGRI